MKENGKFRDSRVNYAHGIRAVAWCLGCICLLFLLLPEFGFSAAIVVRGNLGLSGNVVVVDSFDSTDPAKSTNGQYDRTKAGDHGDIYAGFIRYTGIVPYEYPSSVAIGNSAVYGTLTTGSATISLGPTGAVGTHAWQTNGGIGIEPGFSLNTNVVLTDVTVPPGLQYITPITNSDAVVLSNGCYFATSLGNTIVTGPSTLIIASNFPIGNLVIAPGGSLTVYVESGSCIINSLGITNATGVASNLLILCAPAVSSLTLQGAGSFVGIIDAPEANATVNVAGNVGLDFSGTLIANSLNAGGRVRVHSDESLGQWGYLVFPVAPFTPTLYSPIMWTNGLFSFVVDNATRGDKCVVETSTDLMNWVPVFTNTVYHTFEYTDTNAVSQSQCFYRTVYVQ